MFLSGSEGSNIILENQERESAPRVREMLRDESKWPSTREVRSESHATMRNKVDVLRLPGGSPKSSEGRAIVDCFDTTA